MANRVVIGSQWGDEGKAKVVDFLTLDADYIVRFQGGARQEVRVPPDSLRHYARRQDLRDR